MNNPLVSVVIPFFKAKEYILETIYSVLTQSYKNFEIIIVDDGSDEHFPELLEFFGKNNIKYLKKGNGGPASARNLGAKEAQGELLAFLDADDLWDSEKLGKQVVLMQTSGSQLVYSKKVDFVSETNELIRPVYKCYRGDVLRQLIRNNFITNSSVLLRKDVFEEVGGFVEDRKYFSIEDYQLWLRVCSKFKCDFVDEELVRYRIHQNQISTNSKVSLKKLMIMFWDLFRSNELGRFRSLLLFRSLRMGLGYFKA